MITMVLLLTVWSTDWLPDKVSNYKVLIEVAVMHASLQEDQKIKLPEKLVSIWIHSYFLDKLIAIIS
jgi:hypothetical protein